MVRRWVWTLLGATVFSGFGATAALTADDFSDFPDVPEMDRMDTAFRDAGFYVGARGGLVWSDDTTFSIAGPVAVQNAYEVGEAGSVFGGFELPDLYHGFGLRLEGEVGIARLDVESHTVGGAPVAQANSFGATDSVFATVNAYADYALGAVRPFVGGGLGFAHVDFDRHGITAAPNVMNDASTGLAWQVMGGIGYDVTSQFTLEAMVRYQGIEDVGLTSTTGPKTQVDLRSTHVMFGARFSF